MKKPKEIPLFRGKMVKLIRRRSKMNQTDFAKYIGVYQSALSRIESGFQAMTSEEFIRLFLLSEHHVMDMILICKYVVKVREEMNA